MGIIDSIMGTAGKAVDWSSTATPDKEYAEGQQDAARHTAWMADSAALIEEATKRGLMTPQVRKWVGENPADALDYLARGVGAWGAMGMGAAVEGMGAMRELGKAGRAAIGGDFKGAGGIISEAINSGAMDLHNNAAGATTFAGIKDEGQRREAILRASQAAPVTPDVGVSPRGAMLGELVRRR